MSDILQKQLDDVAELVEARAANDYEANGSTEV